VTYVEETGLHWNGPHASRLRREDPGPVAGKCGWTQIHPQKSRHLTIFSWSPQPPRPTFLMRYAMTTDSIGARALVLPILLALLILTSPGITAQESSTALPATIAPLHATTMARLSASTRAWIIEQGRRSASGFTDAAAFRSATLAAVRARYPTATPSDAAAITELILAEAYRSAASDASASSTRLSHVGEVRTKIREYMKSLGEEIARNAGRKPTDNCSTESCARLAKNLGTLMTAMRNAGIATITMSPTIVTVGDLQLVSTQLDAATKRLEEQASKDDEYAQQSKAHRDRIRTALADYIAKVSAIKGNY
jgi:hypothetical protein